MAERSGLLGEVTVKGAQTMSTRDQCTCDYCLPLAPGDRMQRDWEGVGDAECTCRLISPGLTSNIWIYTRWTMLLIRTLGARIRTSLICEGSVHVMSSKMVDLLTFVCFRLCQQKVYGRVLRAAVQFDHVTLFFFNI